MGTKLKYITTAGIALILGFMGTLGVDLVDEQPIAYDEGYLPYSCELGNVDDYMCYKLSRVGVTGVNRNCYYNRDKPAKYKVCSTGWEKTVNLDECPDLVIVGYVTNCDTGETDKYICNGFDEKSACKTFVSEMPFET